MGETTKRTLPRALLIVPVLCCGCHAAVRRDPIAEARAVTQAAAQALAAQNQTALDRLVRRSSAREDGEDLAAERTLAVGQLQAAAKGTGRSFARARIAGPLATQAVLERTADGWRVDPTSINAVLPTPSAAIEQLIAALDRLPSDPALALLSRSLRDSIVTASADRVRALRELLPRIPVEFNGRLPLHLEYGQGFFVVLRSEDGGWRIDDFN